MEKFLKENSRFDRLSTGVFLAIIISALIIGGAVYFSGKKPGKSSGEKSEVISNQKCQNIPQLPDSISKLATKIIDGDTFLIEGGYSVRILGIDADERDNPCYEPTKNRLEELILNKEVKLEKGTEDKDQWCRYLRYVLVGDKNISLELVKEGLAVVRFSPEDVKYREQITQAEQEAKESQTGCKWSSTAAIAQEKKVLDWEELTTEKIGLKVVGACQAGNYYGEEMIIEGKVTGTFRSKTNTVFLNIEKAYPNQCFVGVIFSSDQYKFASSPEEYYSNKVVRIKGEVKEYQGKPEIILKDPSQIEVGK